MLYPTRGSRSEPRQLGLPLGGGTA